MSTISSSSCAYEAIVRTSHTSPPALTTTTCTSLPFTNPAFTTPSLAQRPETRTATRWERTRHDRQRNEKHCETERRSNSEKCGPSLRDPVDSGTFWARDSIVWCRCWFALAQTSEEFVCSSTLGRWPSLLCKKKKPAVHSNKAAISSWPRPRAIESAVPHLVVTALSGSCGQKGSSPPPCGHSKPP